MNDKKVFSFRLSSDTVEIIDKQDGNNRTEKFEDLVYRRAKDIKRLDGIIKDKENKIAQLEKDIEKLRGVYQKIRAVEKYIDWAFRKVELPTEEGRAV